MKGKSQQGYLWTYSRPGGDVLFEWQVSRSREGDFPVTVTAMAKAGEESLPKSENGVDFTTWQGDISAVVKYGDLGTGGSLLKSVVPLMRGKTDYVNTMADAILAARLDDFERYVAIIPTADWERAINAFTHRNWGLTLLPAESGEPRRIQLLGHVSRVSQVLNERLLDAAMEGARGLPFVLSSRFHQRFNGDRTDLEGKGHAG